ncbi:hypothetical protein CMI37_07985 [Candidatus Pacearchaeota archaeon]|nr:hypothetical protein [Candidatus Pacearchaeota archaeon]
MKNTLTRELLAQHGYEVKLWDSGDGGDDYCVLKESNKWLAAICYHKGEYMWGSVPHAGQPCIVALCDMDKLRAEYPVEWAEAEANGYDHYPMDSDMSCTVETVYDTLEEALAALKGLLPEGLEKS